MKHSYTDIQISFAVKQIATQPNCKYIDTFENPKRLRPRAKNEKNNV